MTQNICLFVPHHKDYDSIHTINFVFESEPQYFSDLKSQSVYKMYYVTSGEGYIHTADKKMPLESGDVFFTFPNFPFCIESQEDFSYMYISFIGTRANMILEKLKINRHRFIFKNCNEIEPIWNHGINIVSELSDLISESIILYTFTHIGSKMTEFNPKTKAKDNISLYIKKIIDDNFSDTNFSLETISQDLSYNKKYISAVFKKETGIGIVEYLNTIRIQSACALINQGFTSVSDIAHNCGFSDPQYFSKVFKKQLEVSPIKYIKNKNLS